MRTITIKFEYPDNYSHEEIVQRITGSITDMDIELANNMTYEVVHETDKNIYILKGGK